MSVTEHTTDPAPLHLPLLARDTVADQPAIDRCVQEINTLLKCGPSQWAFQKSPENDVGLLLNPFDMSGGKKIVLYPFRLTFRMFSQTSPTEHARQAIRSILGPDYEYKFGYLDTQWETDDVIYVESAVFDANLKVAKGLGDDKIPMDAQVMKRACPYKGVCANILFSRKLAEAVGVIQTDGIEAFHTYHPQPTEVVRPVVATALKVTAESVSMVVGRDEPTGLTDELAYASDMYRNLFLVDKSWNKKLSALVKAMYWTRELTFHPYAQSEDIRAKYMHLSSFHGKPAGTTSKHDSVARDEAT